MIPFSGAAYLETYFMNRVLWIWQWSFSSLKLETIFVFQVLPSPRDRLRRHRRQRPHDQGLGRLHPRPEERQGGNVPSHRGLHERRRGRHEEEVRSSLRKIWASKYRIIFIFLFFCREMQANKPPDRVKNNGLNSDPSRTYFQKSFYPNFYQLQNAFLCTE